MGTMENRGTSFIGGRERRRKEKRMGNVRLKGGIIELPTTMSSR